MKYKSSHFGKILRVQELRRKLLQREVSTCHASALGSNYRVWDLKLNYARQLKLAEYTNNLLGDNKGIIPW